MGWGTSKGTPDTGLLDQAGSPPAGASPWSLGYGLGGNLSTSADGWAGTGQRPCPQLTEALGPAAWKPGSGVGQVAESGEAAALTAAPRPARTRQNRVARAGRAGEAQPEGTLGQLSSNTDDIYRLP